MQINNRIKLMKKKTFAKVLLLLVMGLSQFAFISSPVYSQDPAETSEVVTIEVLERSDCVHCLDEKAFLEQLKKTRTDISVVYYDIDIDENRELWKSVAEAEKLPKVTPITLIGGTVVQGFGTADTTGKVFESLIESEKGKKQLTFQEVVDMGGTGNAEEVEGGGCDEDSETCAPTPYEPLYVKVPFFGNIDVKAYSLPTLSIILGFVDGFNPCAMWVLVTFLLVLVQIGDRKRMWQIAGLFIVAEAVMYYLILNVWFTVWDFVGLDEWVTPIVGFIAIGGGLFFLSEWWKGRKSGAVCNVTNGEQRQKTRSRIQRLATAEWGLITIIGIIGLALSVNIIEFACSIGIPQAFTKILELNSLSLFWKHFYISLYILFYMVDDFIVFGIALYSVEKIGITSKYANACHLIGGVLMIILGFLLIFARDLLVL
jgi:cytochrome c biogenesis protein CcdA/glutaredoxin